MRKPRSAEAHASAMMHTKSRSSCIAKRGLPASSKPSPIPARVRWSMRATKTPVLGEESDFGARSSCRRVPGPKRESTSIKSRRACILATPDNSEEADQVFQLPKIDMFSFEDPFERQRLLVQCSNREQVSAVNPLKRANGVDVSRAKCGQPNLAVVEFRDKLDGSTGEPNLQQPLSTTSKLLSSERSRQLQRHARIKHLPRYA